VRLHGLAGFEFEDLEFAHAADVLRLFPKEAELIRRLCRE
jgi:predicted cupin superfamily sugar epimerase